MDFMKAELDKEFSSIGMKSQRRNLKVGKQHGKTNVAIDKKRKALMPGKRMSKTGKIYYEGRRNRSDAKGSKV